MKNTFVRIFVTVLVCLSFAGCSDFLKERETTTYDGAALVNSPKSLESAVLGIHRQFALSGFKTGAFCEWLSPASGISHWSNTNALINPLKRWSCCLNFTRYANHPEAYDSFKSFYRTIYLCNHFLETMDKYASDVEGKFKEEKDRDYYIRCREEIRGEVLFIRAMAYFYLVRLYGDVSLYLDAPDSSDQIEYQARENFWTVYCQIVKDLDKAASQMRDFNRMCSISASVAGGTTGNASGRVCRHSAVACRSLVYLTIGTLLDNSDDNFWVNRTPDFSEIGISTAEDAFRLALADAKKVIPTSDGGVMDPELGATPFRLQEVYGDLFRWEEPQDWQSLERVWALPRAPESSDSGSALTMWALPNYYNGTSKVENFGRCRPDRWFFQKWCETYRGTKGTGANNSRIYVDCEDPRMKVNLVYNSYKGKLKEDGTPMLTNCYPADNRIHPGDDNLMKYYGLPFYVKYYDKTFDNSMGNADFYLMRLAEVYFIAAEACAHLGETNDAVAFVNHILTRARKTRDADGKIVEAAEPRNWNPEDYPEKDQLVAAIFWERCFEMPFEHHDYFDTHRFGAQWIIDNISVPKNEFLYLAEQEDYYNEEGERVDGYRTTYYGSNFKYKTTVSEVRRGLISSYPYDELVYNTKLDETLQDPLNGQNPSEVCWESHEK